MFWGGVLNGLGKMCVCVFLSFFSHVDFARFRWVKNWGGNQIWPPSWSYEVLQNRPWPLGIRISI